MDIIQRLKIRGTYYVPRIFKTMIFFIEVYRHEARKLLLRVDIANSQVTFCDQVEVVVSISSKVAIEVKREARRYHRQLSV